MPSLGNTDPVALPAPPYCSIIAFRDEQACGRELAEEVPLALEYGGFPYAVMMGTPADLEDFAVGFSITEGIVRELDEIRALQCVPRDDAIRIQLTLDGRALHRLLARRRSRALRGHTGCGLCGTEDLQQVDALPLPSVVAGPLCAKPALEGVLRRLREAQPLSRRTHGAHAAAWVSEAGIPLLVREDVGRHNALDKLIGATLRGGQDLDAGFCLITSRCSFEMVQKTLAAGIRTLVAVSAPTARAVRTARTAGLTLLTLDRFGSETIYSAPTSPAID